MSDLVSNRVQESRSRDRWELARAEEDAQLALTLYARSARRWLRQTRTRHSLSRPGSEFRARPVLAHQPGSPCALDRLLATFTQHAFESHRLASSVPVRDLGRLTQYQGGLGGSTENYTRWTQGATDLTGASGVSDEGLIMDAGDRGRATEDLKLFKVRSSAELLCSRGSGAWG